MFVLTACSPPATLEPIAEGGTILAFGDSLTVGYGVSAASSYPAVLAELTGLHVINAGVSGETSDRGLERLPDALDSAEPDLLVLIHGGNDILQNRSLAELEANLGAMIELAHSRGVPVVLIGVPQKALFSNSAPLYEALAEHYQLAFDAELIADLQRSPAMKSDHVHFNANGYRAMAEAIYALLEENGALQ